MKIFLICVIAVLALSSACFAASDDGYQARQSNLDPLNARIAHFDVSDAILRDGMSELSLKKVDGLHLGFEEVLRERISDDPRAHNTHFSLHLEGKTVRGILDELCRSDVRYAWSKDGGTVNIYPRATTDDHSYLLNLWIENIGVHEMPDPDQALTPLSKLFPDQQVGYFGPGLGDSAYDKPWTASFAG